MAKAAHGPEVPKEGIGENLPQTADILRSLRGQTDKTLEQRTQDREVILAAREPVINQTEDQLQVAARQFNAAHPDLNQTVPELYMAA